MTRKTKRSSGLEAADDDPVMLANRAIREAHKAIRTDDAVGLRQAAEKGWLAVSSAADVAAERLGMGQLRGAKSRHDALTKLEQLAGLRKGRLVHRFELARAVLHGECFHEARCVQDETVLSILSDMHSMAKETVRTLGKIRSRW